MNPALASSVAAIGRVTPKSIDRPKRFAQELNKFLGGKTLSECQAVTAHVYGHVDWHSLQTACSSKTNGAPFDEELGDDDFAARDAAQIKVMCLDLFDFNPEKMEPDPPEPEAPGSMTEEQLGKHLQESTEHAHKRSNLAIARLDKTFSEWFLLEQMPTYSISVPPKIVEPDVVGIATQEFMSTYPQRVAQWWNVNVPYQPEVGMAISRFPWNKDRVTSILWFARYWGQLGVLYSGVIDFMMGPGTAYLLAEQFCKAASTKLGVGKMAKEEAENLLISLESNFMSDYPRADYYKLGPQGLRRCAKEAVKVLSDPKSRRGTWKQ